MIKIIALTLMLFATAALSADGGNDMAAQSKALIERAGEMAKKGQTPGLLGIPVLPTKESVQNSLTKAEGASKKGNGNIGEIVDRAYLKQKGGTPSQNTAATTAGNVALRRAETADPAELAKLFQRAQMKTGIADPKDELLVFVSTSIPPEALKMIGAQAARAGAVLVLRGVKGGGLSGKNIKATQLAMKPAIDMGADVQINPELFKRYDVTMVPTTVLAAAGKGCEEGLCAQHAALVGDVSLTFALNEFAQRNDGLGRIAEERLKKMDAR